MTNDRSRPVLPAPAIALAAGGVVLAALVAIYLILTSAPLAIGPFEAATLDPAHVPPVGEVWFGTAVDAQTLELTGRGDAVTTGATVAMVARLTLPVTSGQAVVQVELGDTMMASNTLNMPGSGAGDVVAWTLAFPVAGRYRVLVVEPATDQTLAAGVVTSR